MSKLLLLLLTIQKDHRKDLYHDKPKQPLLETIDEDEPLEKGTNQNKDVKDVDEIETFVKCFQEYTTKDILKGISLYFNPGSMIGIMGPSGCGKTTFLDILTGRRRKGKFNVTNYLWRGTYIITTLFFIIGRYLHQWFFN